MKTMKGNGMSDISETLFKIIGFIALVFVSAKLFFNNKSDWK